ncbi:hypothetical protein XENOCAPTIV_018634 [Xenoophorus captivus]|uniref:Uncharacterized protein n=1 Tax=Xenoophorus captivus TaxID=1517983 RepID=A0ABV0R438_9TELE
MPAHICLSGGRDLMDLKHLIRSTNRWDSTNIGHLEEQLVTVREHTHNICDRLMHVRVKKNTIQANLILSVTQSYTEPSSGRLDSNTREAQLDVEDVRERPLDENAESTLEKFDRRYFLVYMLNRIFFFQEVGTLFF